MRKVRLRQPPRPLVAAALAAALAGSGIAAAAVGAREPMLAPLHAIAAAGPEHLAANTDSHTNVHARVAPAGHLPSAAAPHVAPLRRLVTADYLVTMPRTISAAEAQRVLHLAGVRTLDQVDLGALTVAGAKVRAIGVDPSALRGWTPKPTAASDPLWASVARGELTASFDLAHEARLPLGGDATVAGWHRPATPMRVGAFASMGLPDVDAVVTRPLAKTLGFTLSSAMLVSAPKADPQTMRWRFRHVLGPRADVEALRQLVIVRDAGSYLTRQQIYTALKVALAQVNKPYLWGGVGPASFDCSGLVGFAFHFAGVDMPRTAAQQWFAGPHVPPSDARPGDLLFWANDPTAPGFIDHVAIYLGNGLMVSAPHTGLFVHVSAVPTNNLMGVVRVDPAMSAAVGGPHWPA